MTSALWTLLGALFFEALLGLAFIAWREGVHDKRLQNLLDRVQAGTLTQYKQAAGPPKPPPKGRAPLREGGGES